MSDLASVAASMGFDHVFQGSFEEYIQHCVKNADARIAREKAQENYDEDDTIYVTPDTPNLKELFMQTIHEEAKKADKNKKNRPVKYYKLFGKTRSGHLSETIGNKPEQFEVPVKDLILSGNNMYRVWIKLYEHCKSFSQGTADILLPPFDDKSKLEGFMGEETTILEFIDKFLEEFYDQEYQTDGPASLYSITLL